MILNSNRKNWKRCHGIFFALLLTVCCMAPADTMAFDFWNKKLTLIENGKPNYIIVLDSNDKPSKFAAKELNNIIQKTTGAKFEIADINSDQAKKAAKRIIIGKNSLSEKLLGKKLLESLKSQESLVTGKGNDLLLVGGDGWGTIYAVYEYLERETGWRQFSARLEKIVKTDKAVFSGKEIRTIPAFTGYRKKGKINNYDFEKFSFRNRSNFLSWGDPLNGKSLFAPDCGLETVLPERIPGHGFLFFIPAESYRSRMYTGGKKPAVIKGYFKEHPEYFSLNRNGKRDPRAQLCLSNPEVRKLLTEKVEFLIKLYGKGRYMVGSNDFHNTRYCFCEDCVALEKKYDSIGGPLFDYILELCNHVKKYPGVYIHTLAYKGPNQTEKAPKNIVFPENFIVDYAPVTLKGDYTYFDEPEYKLPNGEMYQTFKNLKEWEKITKHRSAWFYLLTAAPYALYEKIQADMQALQQGGVESVLLCGSYCTQFNDMQVYLFYRMCLDPNQDARAIVKEFVDFKFGPAAPLMMQLIDDVEKNRRDTRGIKVSAEYSSLPVESKRLIKWQKMFDEMEKLTAGDKRYAEEVRAVRSAFDAWHLLFYSRITRDCPEYKVTTETLIKRGMEGEELLKRKDFYYLDQHYSRRIFDEMQLYSKLKTDQLPAELLKLYPGKQIHRHLPENKVETLHKTADSITGYSLKVKLDVSQFKNGNVPLLAYDWIGTKFHHNNKVIPRKDIVPGKFKLYKMYSTQISAKFTSFVGGWTKARLKFGRYYDPSYQRKKYDVWFSMRFTGPYFDTASKEKDNCVEIEQAFLVDMGLDE